VKTRGSTPDATALLFSFVGALQSRLETDETLRAACATLQRFGLSPLLRVELVAGGDKPRAVCAERSGVVTQWSEQDVDLLRSVGIASERNDPDPGSPQSRRRQPR
jgi:hypothetical protein